LELGCKNKNEIIILGTTLGTVFAVSKIAGWVSNIGLLIGAGGAAGTGLAGMLFLLKALAVVWLISIVVKGIPKTIDTLKMLGQEIQKNGGFWKSWQDGVNIIFNNLRNTIQRWINDIKKQFGNLSSGAGLGGGFSSSSGFGGGGSGGSRFASGGVVRQPTFGLVGEYGNASSNPEIISPQSIMRDTLRQALEPIMAGQGTQQQAPITLNINGKEMAKAIYQDMQYEANRLGVSSSVAVRRVG
jgi:hypothetical protein